VELNVPARGPEKKRKRKKKRRVLRVEEILPTYQDIKRHKNPSKPPRQLVALESGAVLRHKATRVWSVRERKNAVDLDGDRVIGSRVVPKIPCPSSY
jgi:hypothetical protein